MGDAVLRQRAVGWVLALACVTPTRTASVTRYSWLPGATPEPTGVAVLLLVGGGGTLDLDSAGCPQRLKHNILVRTAPLLRAAGVTTALVDAPSDWRGDDGLAGFRLDAAHAADLGQVVADLRRRSGARAVWLIGHSRGSLSAANAAGRLTGAQAPEGVVLASPMLYGEPSKRRPWVAQTLRDTDVLAYGGALLLVGHAADNCPRSLSEGLEALAQGAGAARVQVARVTGGPQPEGRSPSLAACEVGQAHDFVDQDRIFVEGVLRFIQGGRF
jgi:pimeloyl-ACP methyl ester carboxylesterase